jgi:hypothetical protein
MQSLLKSTSVTCCREKKFARFHPTGVLLQIKADPARVRFGDKRVPLWMVIIRLELSFQTSWAVQRIFLAKPIPELQSPRGKARPRATIAMQHVARNIGPEFAKHIRQRLDLISGFYALEGGRSVSMLRAGSKFAQNKFLHQRVDRANAGGYQEALEQ